MIVARLGFFQLNPPSAEEIHLRWMKSLRDEIPLRGDRRGGFNFIWGGTPKISSEPHSDFIVRSTISLTFYQFRAIISERGDNYAENKLADMSTEFAVKILNLTDGIKGHYSLANQLERSGTSIGANIREAKYAHSKADFVAKLQISLKECYETEYWIEIAQKAERAQAFWLRKCRLKVWAFSHFSNLHAQRTPSQLGTEFSFSKSDAFGFRYNTQYIHQAPPQDRRQNRKCDNKSLLFSAYWKKTHKQNYRMGSPVPKKTVCTSILLNKDFVKRRAIIISRNC